MYLLVKSGGHNPYRNGDFNFHINFYMNTLEKAELITSVSHIERFSKSGMPIYSFDVPGTAGRKATTRRKKTGNCKALCVSRKCKHSLINFPALKLLFHIDKYLLSSTL